MVGLNPAAKIYCFVFAFFFIVESVNGKALLFLTGKNLTNFWKIERKTLACSVILPFLNSNIPLTS